MHAHKMFDFITLLTMFHQMGTFLLAVLLEKRRRAMKKSQM